MASNCSSLYQEPACLSGAFSKMTKRDGSLPMKRRGSARILSSCKKWKAFVSEEHNSSEATESITGIPAETARVAARLYAIGANAAICYGLGVAEHSRGSTMVNGIANPAMANGNIGREGVGVNPLRGQYNVQGSCDMGSFPHEFPGYCHVGQHIGCAEIPQIGRIADLHSGAAHRVLDREVQHEPHHSRTMPVLSRVEGRFTPFSTSYELAQPR